jgi:hypothetical protein
LLEGLLYVEEDLCNHSSIYARKGQSLGTQRNDLKHSLQSLKLVQNQLELLLQKVSLSLLIIIATLISASFSFLKVSKVKSCVVEFLNYVLLRWVEEILWSPE